MILVSVLVVFLLALTAEAQVGTPTETWMYDSICKTDNYEVRQYDAATWVSTNSSMFTGFEDAIQRLSEYFNGSNADGTIIGMVSPLIVTIPDNGSLGTVFKWSFLLPSSFSFFPPAPLDNLVFFTDTTAMRVFVLRPLSINNTNIFNIRNKIIEDIFHSIFDLAGTTYSQDFHYAALFDPFMPSFGQSELWFHALENLLDSREDSSSEELFTFCP